MINIAPRKPGPFPWYYHSDRKAGPVYAHTKSEARAIFKRQFGLRRLPKTATVSIAPCEATISIPIVGPNDFRCAMCGGVFPKEWSDEVARAEQISKGIPADEPCGLVCDDCYKLTPWGSTG